MEIIRADMRTDARFTALPRNDESFHRVEERVEEFSEVPGWDNDCLEENGIEVKVSRELLMVHSN